MIKTEKGAKKPRVYIVNAIQRYFRGMAKHGDIRWIDHLDQVCQIGTSSLSHCGQNQVIAFSTALGDPMAKWIRSSLRNWIHSPAYRSL